MGKTKHGMWKTKEWNAWNQMKMRCYNPKHEFYKNYGGRGISVCDRWLNSFENFFADMGFSPTKAHSLDRTNNDGNYEPNNCRWATKLEQVNNRRIMKDSIYLKARQNGILGMTAYYRIKRGWSVDDAVSIPPNKKAS